MERKRPGRNRIPGGIIDDTAGGAREGPGPRAVPRMSGPMRANSRGSVPARHPTVRRSPVWPRPRAEVPPSRRGLTDAPRRQQMRPGCPSRKAPPRFCGLIGVAKRRRGSFSSKAATTKRRKIMEKARTRSETSTLEQEREALLQKALARPGIREVMQVYGSWKERDEWLNSYRDATRKSFEITDTNHTNPR